MPRVFSFCLISLSCVFACVLDSEISSAEISEFIEKDLKDKDDDPSVTYRVTEKQFWKVIETAKDIYKPQSGLEWLIIRGDWNSSSVNAKSVRLFGVIYIHIYGGIARRPEVSPDALALVLCHEIGHTFGGPPYKTILKNGAVEGQADYYAAKECLKKMLPRIPLDEECYADYLTDYIIDRCSERYEVSSPDYKICLRQLAAGQSAGHLLSSIKNTPIPDYETPDQTKVKKTMKLHPSVQCRLDTYHSGILGLPRPRCWYKEGSLFSD